MKLLRSLLTVVFALTILFLMSVVQSDELFIQHTVDVQQHNLRLYWKNDQGKPYGSLGRLRAELRKQGMELTFAMNGGMYMTDQRPLGLYIENGKELAPINKVTNAHGNFYLQPNGVFYWKNNGAAGISVTQDFKDDGVKYATQSGPMLITKGVINPLFGKNSPNLHVRNGVGILSDGKVIFAMSKEKVTFYQLASFFKSKGCENALYLDGFVSRTYLPEKNWVQADGQFGVIIGQTTGQQ